jgi:transcriptional regulator with XRE-family HTH domain
MGENRSFGELLRAKRLSREKTDPAFSLRQVAARADLEPSYLSKIERGLEPPPGEETIRGLAQELGENPDALLALGGKVSADLLEIIRERPTVVADLLRFVRKLPARRFSEMFSSGFTIRRRESGGTMPEISRFYGIRITMNYAEHLPPHFHAEYAGEFAQVLISTGEILHGSLPRRAAALVREWTLLHRSELEDNWNLREAMRPLNRIDPLP